MSLLDEFREPFCMMDKTSIPDGYGGITRGWKEGAGFQAAAVKDNSMEARVGEVEGVTAVYTITTSRGVHLEYHDVVKRISDEKIFRITSDGDDAATPKSASIDMRIVTAEEFKLTS